ncbi:conserved hypothetical protein [Anaeromyxobacter dehalogenans 2CP-1]|uniref:Uncharacterized protein n=1 Tax=Anaeromyxobacter dehalogenans (strain ATCC BAA-258 / DSM 21875 / 2CP-1) TaxID=455488 RepID=B8J9D5_ANAD2|nr:hypothetical protein [Anaeromyxobacter dehalogenans]ACL65541.1 conserved hypothetical protein [Anaeromyxobacter dehalogenans 2CP-1]
MLSRILAFRPPGVLGRLPPRSGACPLSLRELMGPAVELGTALPLVAAPSAAVARAALVAAKELGSALGLALPAGTAPEPWFATVTAAADEVAAGLPIFLSAEVRVEGEAAMQVDRACEEAWRLVDAGLTHLAIDAAEVAAEERARVLAEVAAGALERGVCVDCVVPIDPGAPAARHAAVLFEALAACGAPPDVASVRCPAPSGPEDARAQVGALARLSAALAGVPVVRRGPVSRPLLGLLAGSPVKACEDGGAAAARARAPLGGGADEADRREARVYVEVMDFLERLGAAGSARGLARALEARLTEGGA